MTWKMNLRHALLACAALVSAAMMMPSPAAAETYHHVNEKYGYTIDCPQKPVGIIPASVLYEDGEMQGEVLVFDNEEFYLKNAWVIRLDAFTDGDLPDLDKLTPEESAELCQKLLGRYDKVEMISLNDGHKGVFAVTAKEMQLDTNGDGTPDTTATADTQLAITFFRGEKGGRFAIELIDNPDLTEGHIAAYRAGLASFRETGQKS